MLACQKIPISCHDGRYEIARRPHARVQNLDLKAISKATCPKNYQPIFFLALPNHSGYAYGMSKSTESRIIWSELSDDQRAQAKVCAQEWIDNALSTGRMTPEERELVHLNIARLYRAGGCAVPKATVVVQSPKAMALIGGAAAWWWYEKKRGNDVDVLSCVAPELREALTSVTTGCAPTGA